MKHLHTALYTPYFLQTAKLNSVLAVQTSSLSICRSTYVNEADNSSRSKNALAFDNQLRTSFTYGACGITSIRLHVLACAGCRGRLVYMTTFARKHWPPPSAPARPRLFITGLNPPHWLAGTLCAWPSIRKAHLWFDVYLLLIVYLTFHDN